MVRVPDVGKLRAMAASVAAPGATEPAHCLLIRALNLPLGVVSVSPIMNVCYYQGVVVGNLNLVSQDARCCASGVLLGLRCVVCTGEWDLLDTV